MSADLEPYQAPPTPALRAGNLDYPTILKLGEAFAASGLFSDVKDAGTAAVKIMAGAEMGLEPVAAMNGIDIIPGRQGRGPRMRPNADVQAWLAARAGYTYRAIEHTAEKCILEWAHDGKVIGTSEFSVAQARKAGLVRDGGAWNAWPEPMTLARAVTLGVKLYCRHVLAGQIGGMPMVTMEELDTEYPDPRDDLVKALHATYREVYPKRPDETAVQDREQRLMWSELRLGRCPGTITTWNGPQAPETLTRADVQTLLDALESTPALTRGQAAPISPGAPSAAGADSTAPSSSAVGGSSPTERQSPAPAEHHTAEVREVAPADGTVPAGESRSDTGLPPGAAPARKPRIHPMENLDAGEQIDTARRCSEAHQVDPFPCDWHIADTIQKREDAAKPKPAPTRTRHKTDPTGAPGVKEAMREAQQFRDDRRTQTEVERTPTDPIQSMPPKFRELYLKHFGNEMEPALGSVNSHIETWGPKWPAIGDGAPWNLELLRELAADTFEKDMYR